MWSCRGPHGRWYQHSHGACRAHKSSWPPRLNRGTRVVLGPSVVARDPAIVGSGRDRDLPSQRLGVRARVRAQPLPTTPTRPRAAIAFPVPSPLKRGLARSRVVTAIVVVFTPRIPGTLHPRVQQGKGTRHQTSLPAEVSQKGKSGPPLAISFYGHLH